ncbi:MAG: hypothetical protein NC078_05040 [Ruminococcus sp.]|nr:hypothetical protein [Ruminococcus sp.]
MANNIGNYVSRLGKTLSRHKIETALGCAGVGCFAASCVMRRKAQREYEELVRIRTENAYEPLKELEKFMAGMEKVIYEQRKLGLKRELTKEEMDEIEKRIYFEKKSMREVLTEMDLMKK